PQLLRPAPPASTSRARGCTTTPTSGSADPPPTWHQVAEVPRTAAVVTAFQGHCRTCPGCAHRNHHPIPAALKADAFGPRLAAALAYLRGSQHVSTRGLDY